MDDQWRARIEALKAQGYPVICPTGGDIRCIRGDGTMLEHECADHPSYLGPVVVEYCGTSPIEPEFATETHALVYADPNVALTIYEYCYALWSLKDGRCLWGNLWRPGEYRLPAQSMGSAKRWGCHSRKEKGDG